MEEKYLIVYYPGGYDTSIETFSTLKELEEAVKDNYTNSRVIACKILEQKLFLED